MVAVLSREDASGGAKRLGRCQRAVLVCLFTLALFGITSIAASEKAEAHDYWATVYQGGVPHNCYYVYYTDGNHYLDGCEWYLGNSYPAYYTNVNGVTWVWKQYNGFGGWSNVSDYWSSLSNTYGYARYEVSFLGNESAFSYLQTTAARIGRQSCWVTGCMSTTTLASTGAESTLKNPNPAARSDVPPPPSDASRTAEASADSEAVQTSEVSSAAFPWKVCQDNNSNCMKYGKDAWKQVSTSNAQGGTYRVSSSQTRGAFFKAAGDTDAGGSTMQLTTTTGPQMGKAKVLVVNLASSEVVKRVTFDLRTAQQQYKVAKKITNLTPHKAYGLIVLSADGRPVAVDAVGYEAHGSMCHVVQ